MEKTKTYHRIRFDTETIVEATGEWLQTLPDPAADVTKRRRVVLPEEEWTHDTDEEFYADLQRGPSTYTYSASVGQQGFNVMFVSDQSSVTVKAPSRSPIERVFRIFDKHAASCVLDEADLPGGGPAIFIGHRHDDQWRNLKDHLHEQHGYEVEAYEIGSRAGHAIRDILEEMMEESSFALLVFTGEDKDEEGHLRARQNVVHELGLFQGSLGFSRAIVLLEEGTAEFSNIQGIHQIRFPRGHIREVYGDVLAVLRREFGPPPA